LTKSAASPGLRPWKHPHPRGYLLRCRWHSIDRVEFYANGSRVNPDMTTPCVYAWTPGGVKARFCPAWQAAGRVRYRSTLRSDVWTRAGWSLVALATGQEEDAALIIRRARHPQQTIFQRGSRRQVEVLVQAPVSFG